VPTLEYGKLMRTLHALRCFTDEAFRRRIGRQLNLGESVNNFRCFIAHADAAAVIEAKQAWLESAIEHGDAVPEPRYRPAIYAV
jgi:hypothetical protein